MNILHAAGRLPGDARPHAPQHPPQHEQTRPGPSLGPGQPTLRAAVRPAPPDPAAPGSGKRFQPSTRGRASPGQGPGTEQRAEKTKKTQNKTGPSPLMLGLEQWLSRYN